MTTRPGRHTILAENSHESNVIGAATMAACPPATNTRRFMHYKAKLLTHSAMMCALLIISTMWFKFAIPGTDIQFTTQVLFVLLCGQILPPKYCLASMGTYIAIGIAGVPVFSATHGLAVIATPSFGYLISFPIASMTVSFITGRKQKSHSRRYAASLIGVMVIYAIALLYIAFLNAFYFGSPISVSFLFQVYCLAFLPMDILKGVIAAFLGGKLVSANLT